MRKRNTNTFELVSDGDGGEPRVKPSQTQVAGRPAVLQIGRRGGGREERKGCARPPATQSTPCRADLMADSQVGDGARRCFRAGEGDCCVEELGDGDVGGGGGEVPRGGEKRRVPFIFLLFSIYIYSLRPIIALTRGSTCVYDIWVQW